MLTTRYLLLGLGVMGYGMAVNLRKKMDSSQTLLICDVNEGALEKFQAEMNQGPIQVVKTGAEAATRAVRSFWQVIAAVIDWVYRTL